MYEYEMTTFLPNNTLFPLVFNNYTLVPPELYTSMEHDIYTLQRDKVPPGMSI